jgi:hypothetical protein
MPGNVYIRSKIKRGVAGQTTPQIVDRPVSLPTKVVNVTSQQPKLSVFRRAFSPMHVYGDAYVAPDGEAYACYEHYWQSLKHFPGRNHQTDKAWWRRQTQARRRLTGVNPTICLYASDETRYDGELFGYVESRKAFYVPDYSAKLASCALAQRILRYLRSYLDDECDVIIEDFDGPRCPDGLPQIARVTPALLREKLNDPTMPFGHGYVVAAALLGIELAEYE